ncbi:hypothetical protein DM01DRAFT_1212787 [Hesseltinella vesiculosa]|uniref:RNI-like protein n=1 Tax=Hesseltinella vesiculosa TaxID=101127 RepID=A0A1X2G3P3_9FUNG|nr:hypothetical protein DM01DRAFT_1212787 [Hesseltinella vesiculosa]
MVGNIGRMPGEDTVVEQCYTTFVDQHAATVQSLELSLVLTKSIFWEKLTRRSSQLVLAGLDASTYRRTVTPYNTGNVGNDENTVNHPSKLRRALICYKPTVRSFNLTLPSPPLRTHPVYRTEQTFETFCELEGFGQLQHLTLSIPNIPGKRESIGTLPFNNLLQHCPQLTRLDVQKSSLFTSIAGVPASHSLVHLSLDQCYLPEQLLSTAFADLPCLMTFIMDQSTVLLRNTDTPRPDLTIPLELARSDGVAVTIRRLRGLTYRKRRARYVLFGQVTLAHTHRPSRATTWRITHDGQMEETSNGKNQPKQQASSGDSPLHLNIIAENISSFQYESHLVK